MERGIAYPSSTPEGDCLEYNGSVYCGHVYGSPDQGYQFIGTKFDPKAYLNSLFSTSILGTDLSHVKPLDPREGWIMSDPGAKKAFCADQSNKAAVEEILPYGHVLLGDYRPTVVVSATAEVAVDRAAEAAAGSSAFLYWFRSHFGVPMTATAKYLKWFGWASTAYTGYSGMKAMQNEYKACME